MINYNNLLINIVLILSFFVIITKYTCLFNNHIFVIFKKRSICQKCGLIKEIIKND